MEHLVVAGRPGAAPPEVRLQSEPEGLAQLVRRLHDRGVPLFEAALDAARRVERGDGLDLLGRRPEDREQGVARGRIELLVAPFPAGHRRLRDPRADGEVRLGEISPQPHRPQDLAHPHGRAVVGVRQGVLGEPGVRRSEEVGLVARRDAEGVEQRGERVSGRGAPPRLPAREGRLGDAPPLRRTRETQATRDPQGAKARAEGGFGA